MTVHVVLDTNAVHVDSPTEFVKADVVALSTTQLDDVSVTCYLPHVVRHERQRQMYERAVGLIPKHAQIQELMGAPVELTAETVKRRVAERVDSFLDRSGVRELPLDSDRVNWPALVLDAIYRRAPFSPGESEKGFRDRLISESFSQLVADVSRVDKRSRFVLVTGDVRLYEAVAKQHASSSTVHVFASLQDVKNLLNTLSSTISEEVVAAFRSKAAELFWNESKPESLFYRQSLQDRIESEFREELARVPPGTMRRESQQWLVHPPTFISKSGQRLKWESRVEVVGSLQRWSTEALAAAGPRLPLDLQPLSVSTTGVTFDPASRRRYIRGLTRRGSQVRSTEDDDQYRTFTFTTALANTPLVPAGSARSLFDVSWSASAAPTGELLRPKVDGLTHKGTSFVLS